MPQAERLQECEELASRLRLNVRKHRKKLHALSQLLSNNEELLSVTTGLPDGNFRENVIALTNQRLLILKNDPKDAVDYRLAAITNIDGRIGLGGGRLHLSIADSHLTINNVHKDSTHSFLSAARDVVQVFQDRQPTTREERRTESTQTNPDQLVAQDYETALDAPPSPPQGSSFASAETATDSFLFQQINEFDERFVTNTLRHKAKVEAIPTALNSSEYVIFVTEGTLRGATKSDVFVVTDERLVVVRDDGKRIDRYPLRDVHRITLGDIKRHGPLFLLSRLELEFVDAAWAGTTTSLHSAIAFAYAIFDSARTLAQDAAHSPIEVALPPTYQTRNETAIALPFLRGADHDVLVADSNANWEDTLRRMLSLEEVVLGVQSLEDPGGNQLFLAITTEHLIVFKYIDHAAKGRLLSVPGRMPTSHKIPLHSIEYIAFESGIDSELAALTYRADEVSSTIVVGWEYGGLLEDFATDLRYAADFVRSGQSSTGSPADPLYWPAQALDLLVSVGQQTIEPDSEVRDPAFMLTGAPAGRPIASMAVARRNALLNAFALRYGLDLSPLTDAVENLTRTFDVGELLRCLTQTSTEESSGPALLALADDWIYVVGNSAGEVERIPLGATEKVTGQVGRHTGSITLTVAGERRELSSVPNASIDSFVRVAELLRPPAAERLGQKVERLAQRAARNQPLKINPSEDPPATLPAAQGEAPTPKTLPYQPTAIHPLSQEDLADVYERIAAEATDFGDLTKWQLSHLPEVMLPSELLIWLANGYLQGSFKDPGDSGRTMIAVTDRRLLLLVDPLLARNQVKAFRLIDITAVHRDGGFFAGGFRFRESGGGQRKITTMHQSSADSTVAKLQAAIDAAHSPQPRQSQVLESRAPASDVANQLEKLANLVDRGFLTPAEFAEQKAKLLNG